MGLGPDGAPATGHWIVEFQQEQVRFQLSDTWPTASYVCRNGVITATSNQGVFTGSFDPVSGVLLWNGHEYRRTE
jgi:hypothetical protein